MRPLLILSFVLLAGCDAPRNAILECKGLFSVAQTIKDSAAIANRSLDCAWYLGWKQENGQ